MGFIGFFSRRKRGFWTANMTKRPTRQTATSALGYVELHACSAFNFLRGAALPEQLVEVCAELDLPAIALHDRDGVYGAPRFWDAAREQGIRPILGCEITMEGGAILPVLVENRTGYRNLCELITQSKLRGTKTECATRWDELARFAEGLVALGSARASRAGCDASPQRTCAGEGAIASTRGACAPKPARLVDMFGRENVFIEVQRHHIRGEERAVQCAVDFARQHNLPLLATNGVQYARPEQRQALDVLTCIRNHTHLDAAGLLLSQNAERHLKSAAQMQALFADLPEAIENTVRLADRLQFSLENLGYEFPTFPVPGGESMDSFLRKITMFGAHQRYPVISKQVRKKLNEELALIEKLGFAGYFLIVWDIVNFCREKNIMVQGRGSAANSAVCFSLAITPVDPVENKLVFERFLSEGREGWPDIDLDLPSGDRRESVIQEVYRRYGPRGAAMTANVITFRGRSAAREIGKALNLMTDITDRFSSLFAGGDFPHTLDFRAQMEQAGIPLAHPRAPAFVSLYQQLYTLPRHLGQHSGGMIIYQGKLDQIMPLENASMPGRVVGQWDKDDCEQLKIIKVDLLGLGMMAVMQDTFELCRERGCPAELATIPKDDPATFELMQKADTIGVFQIESRAQMATLPRMKPQCFYDVVIEVAIIRPGPIQGHLMHPYLARREGKEAVTYYDPKVVPILERTLGVPLFQEQMLSIAMTMAGWTGTQAEGLRRALSFHRSQKFMQKAEQELRAAMAEKGVSAEVIEQIVAAISSFALYGFPESHAISFAILAYGSAWLKVHRAPEFFASLLNNQPMGFYAPATLIKDAQRRGVKILPVCVSRSEWRCTIENDASIRLGLCVVKGLAHSRAEDFLSKRNERAFDSLDDFKARVVLNKNELRRLAEIGALNCFAEHRRAALWAVEEPQRDDLPRIGRKSRSAGVSPAVWGVSPQTSPDSGQQRADFSRTRRNAMASGRDAHCDRRDACAPTSDSNTPLAPMTVAERTNADYGGMELTIGAHPMALIRPQLPDVWRATDLPQAEHGDVVRIAGNVICRQRPGTARGFVFISVEDETGVANAIVSPTMFEKLRLVVTQESFLLIEGRVQKSGGTIHIQARHIERLAQAPLAGSDSHDFR